MFLGPFFPVHLLSTNPKSTGRRSSHPHLFPCSFVPGISRAQTHTRREKRCSDQELNPGMTGKRRTQQPSIAVHRHIKKHTLLALLSDTHPGQRGEESPQATWLSTFVRLACQQAQATTKILESNASILLNTPVTHITNILVDRIFFSSVLSILFCGSHNTYQAFTTRTRSSPPPYNPDSSRMHTPPCFPLVHRTKRDGS